MLSRQCDRVVPIFHRIVCMTTASFNFNPPTNKIQNNIYILVIQSCSCSFNVN